MADPLDPPGDDLALDPPSEAVRKIGRWLIALCLGAPQIGALLRDTAKRLRAVGVPVDRVHTAYTTLHPLHGGAGATWTPEKGLVEEQYFFHRDPAERGWMESPIRHIIRTGEPEMRRRLTGPDARRDFPLLGDMAAEGYSDYLLLLRPFESYRARAADDVADPQGARTGMVISWASRAQDGFSDADIDGLRWLAGPLAVAMKVANQAVIAETLASCYIGREAGPRVLGGAVRLGDFAETEAVVWMSDLRDSTMLAASYPISRWIPMLNQYLDATVGAVAAEGGEPLTYIGDGALAIFPIEMLGEAGARQAALRAADRAMAQIASLNAARAAEGEPAFRWGLGLHAGRLGYGGIGVPERQSWSVIGPVVNETARIESLTKTIGQPVLASAAFAKGLDPAWTSCGLHALKGVAAPMEVFARPVTGE